MTAMTDECMHGMNPQWCSICLHPSSTPPDKNTLVNYTTASFESQCHVCDLPIYVGQYIGQLASGQWVHAECGLFQ